MGKIHVQLSYSRSRSGSLVCVRRLCGVFEGFQPLDLYSQGRVCFRSRLDKFCNKVFLDPKHGCRCPISCRSVNRHVGWGWRWFWKSARGTGPKRIRWRPAAWDSRGDGHCIRWDAGGIYWQVGSLCNAAYGRLLSIPKQNHDPYRPHFCFDQRPYLRFELFQSPERLA